MYNLEKQTVNGMPIVKWLVHFQTPFGLTSSLEEAIRACLDMNLHPNLCVVPVPVAVTESTYEVVARGN